MAKRSELNEYMQMLHQRDDKIAELQGQNKALLDIVYALDYQLGIIRAVLASNMVVPPKTKE